MSTTDTVGPDRRPPGRVRVFSPPTGPLRSPPPSPPPPPISETQVSTRCSFDSLPSAIVACLVTCLALPDHGRFARTNRLTRRVSLLACASPVEIVLDGKDTGKPRVTGQRSSSAGTSMRFVKPPDMSALYRYRPRRLHFPRFWAVLEDADDVRRLTQMTSVEELALEPHFLMRYPHDKSRVFGSGYPGALAVAALEAMARDMPRLRRLTLYGGDVTIECLAVLPPLLERLCVSGIARDDRGEWATTLARRVPALADFEIDQGFGRGDIVRFVHALPALRRLRVRCLHGDDADDAEPTIHALPDTVALAGPRGLAQLDAFGASWQRVAGNGIDETWAAENTALWSRMRLPNATEICLGADTAGVPVAVILAACGCRPVPEDLDGSRIVTFAGECGFVEAPPPPLSPPTSTPTLTSRLSTDPARNPTVVHRTRGIETLRLSVSRVSGDDLARMIATGFVHRTCHTLEFAALDATAGGSGDGSVGGSIGDGAFRLAPLRHFSALTDLTLRRYCGDTLPELPQLLRLTVDVEFSMAEVAVREAVVIVAAAPFLELTHLCYRGEFACAADASVECRERAHRLSREWSAAVARYMPALQEVDISDTAHVAWSDLASLIARLPRLYRIRVDADTRGARRGLLTTHVGAPTELRNPSSLDRLRAAAIAANVALV